MNIKERIRNWITTIIGAILMLASTTYLSVELVKDSIVDGYDPEVNWFLFIASLVIGLILIGAKDTVIKQILNLRK